MAGKPILTLGIIEKRLFEKHGNNITIKQYNGSRKHSTFHCNICGNIWDADTYSVVSSGHGCPICNKKSSVAKARLTKMNTIESVIGAVIESGCKFISFDGIYNGNTTKMNIIYFCGHSGKVSYQMFQKIYKPKVCPSCSKILADKKKTVSEKDVVGEISDNGFIFICFPNGYKDGKSKIKYNCKYGHENIKTVYGFRINKKCKECSRIKMSLSQIGELSWAWKDGITPIKNFLSKHLKDWKKDSMENCNYKCVISGGKFHEIHHLYSMSSIIRDSFKELKLSIKKNIGDYTQDEIFSIINKFKEIHYRYPLGVCLRKDIHKLYHKLYGQNDTIPNDFIDFVDRINSGEIQIL